MAENEKGEKPQKEKKPKAEGAEGGEKPAKAEKAEKPAKAAAAAEGAPEGGEGEKPAKGDKPGKGEGKAAKGEGKKGGDGGGKKDKKGKAEVPEKPRPPPRLFLRYKKEIVPQLHKELGLKSVSQVPRLEKIVINMGLGEAISNNKILEFAVEELSTITGQKAVVTKARKSIANFKLREGMPIGAMVTLRRAHMWEFLDRLIAVALPRLRDFKGVSDKAFDGRGNYTLGMKEQIIFPEIDYDKVDKVRGMNICICTTADNDVHGRALLQALGVPFRKRGQEQAANG
jgi:large subunit ribosomal protein L5